MSKKTLLAEGTVRRFMKLAEIGPLSGDFVNHMFNEEEEPTPEEAEFDEAEFGAGEEVGELEGEEEAELDLGDEELDVDVEEEEPVEGELTLTDEEAQAFLTVADRIRDALEGAPEPEEVPAPDMGGEEEMDVELGGEEEGEEEFDTGEEELDVDVEDEEEVELQETGAKDTGASKDDESKTRKGEKDYTTKKGEKLKRAGKGRGQKKGDEAYVNESLVNQIVKRVAKRLTNRKR